ncbi:MAG: radical SAM protein [Methanocorpusculum sp.]|nr:radical SAM protein [Methanocorpusculum sp.]
MHFIQAKSLLSSKNGMNIFRGCTHGCIYCDSRSLCYQMPHAFSDVAVKENAPSLLDAALSRKRKKGMIGFGSMSDPYIPEESSLRLTQQCLEIIARRGFGVSLITKSDLVLRDIDILKEIQERAKAVVSVTLTTADDTLCRKIEPNVCPTSRRVEVLYALRDAGIPTVVWLCPILPYINDTKENLEGILSICREAEVKGILSFGFGMTLREGCREYFYQKLDELFPGLSARYAAEFGLRYAVESPNAAELERVFSAFCEKEGIERRPERIFSYLYGMERDRQATLF